MIITGVNGFIGRCAMEYFSKDYEITGIDLADRYCEDGAEIHYYQCNTVSYTHLTLPTT